MNKQTKNQGNTDPDRSQLVQNSIRVLAEASKQKNTPEEFYRQVLEELAEITEISAAFVWVVTPEQSRLVQSVPAGNEKVAEDLEAARTGCYQSLLSSEVQIHELLRPSDHRGKWLGSTTNRKATDQQESERAFQSLAVRLLNDSTQAIVLELVADEEIPLQGSFITSLVMAIREIAEDFHRNYELKRLRLERKSDSDLVAFSKRLLQVDGLSELNFEIVNAATEILEVDRASILSAHGNKINVLAVSGVSSVNQRSEAVKQIEEIARRGIKAGLPARFPDEYRPSMITILQVGDHAPDHNDYGSFDSNSIPAEKFLLVFEDHGEDRLKVSREDKLDKFFGLADLSIRRWSSPEKRQRFLDVFRARRVQWISGIILMLISLLCFVPTTLNVRAEGQISPREERGVFVPTNGEVIDIRVRHNQQVERGEVLVVIHSPDLELKLTDLLGKQQATSEKIRAIEARNAGGNEIGDDSRDQSLLESSSLKELEILQKSQLKQLAILEKQQQTLTIRSPVKGRVMTWQLDQLLRNRQVKQGQRLLNIAADEDGWLAEIEILDHRVGHVLTRLEEKSKPDTECMLLSDPDQRFQGHLVALERTTAKNRQDLAVVKGIAHYDFPQDSKLRSGARIIVTIDCGKRSLGYVYFHEVYYSVLKFLF